MTFSKLSVVMKCLGIVWNSAFVFKNQIAKDIEKDGEILANFELDLNENYENFVRTIYDQDGIAKWKVDQKIEAMFGSTGCRKVNIIVIDVPTGEEYYHKDKGFTVFSGLEKLKKIIRQKYKELVAVYFFDNVFHMTDSDEEYEKDLEALAKFVVEKMEKEDNLQILQTIHRFQDRS